MKTLKAARRSHNVTEQSMRDGAVWARFVRGLHCPYCSTPRNNPEQLRAHMDHCCQRDGYKRGYELAPADPDFPTMGKPIKGTMRWRILKEKAKK